jgi:type 2 lantibiotic biosynthesis protein LanM
MPVEEILRAIVAKASTLRERKGPAFVPQGDAARDATIEASMHRWLWAAAEGDPALFRRRLIWDELDEASARETVGPVQLRMGEPLPAWARVLEQVLGLASAPRPSERCVDPGDPIAFEQLLLPFVTWGRAVCQRRADPAYALFAEKAHAAFERQLLRSLSGHASRALFEEFGVEVALEPLDALLRSEASTELYAAFVERMLSGGLLRFFTEYAALGRVLAQTAELWVAATVELLGRFSSDRDAIGAMLGAAPGLTVANVATSLSDPHNGLRSVAILTLGCGRRVVYKPRRLDIDAGFNALLDWLSAISAPVTFRTFRVLCRDSYGWTECVEYAPCRDTSGAREYYERAGALLCVVHLLHGTDCHGDNLIAAGPHPVLIDVETMLSPKLRDFAPGAEAPKLARLRLTTSVLNTYLLPSYAHALHDGSVFDGSGFGADPDEDRAATFEGWVFVNTDSMKLARRTRDVPAAPRAATADGAVLRVYDYEAELVHGFESMYRFLIQQRATLVATDSPFGRLRGAEVRFVHRNTSLYSYVLRALQQPRFCRDGAERSMQTEQLALLSLTHAARDGRAGWAEIWHAERECMELGDVPQFSVLAGGNTVMLSPERSIAGWFEQSGHDRALERLAGFGEVDLSFQIDVIRSSLRSRAVPSASSAPRASVPLERAGDTAPTDDAFRAEAVAIAELLSRSAILGSDQSAAWLQPVWSREHMLANPKREMDIVGDNLYDGAVGIGLFLAAVEHATKSGLASLALAAVTPLLIELEERGEKTADALGIGGLSGLGSVVYGLAQMSRLLEDPRVLAGAERAARLVTQRRIAEDTALDITLGTAGALLALLSLYEIAPRDETLALAVTCAERLLSAREPSAKGGRALRTLDGRFLNGFSHGAAGIAAALCRLHAVTAESSLLEAATELVQFERDTFSQEWANWPDLRYAGPQRFMAAWCHGAPGIALGRIASLTSMHDDVTQKEIEHALAITARHQTGRADYLCCGTAGLVDILAAAGRRLARPELLQRARVLAWDMVQRAHASGEYSLGLPSAGRLRAPGLFQGLSGIGLTLLRLTRPEAMPEPLLLG